jgi:anaerobic selenocysteine-containing dehydrogenase
VTGASIGTPDYERAGCILLWGYNPTTSWLAAAGVIADARARGAKLVVIDPRHVGFAVKADRWLQVRPGTDGAVALAMAPLRAALTITALHRATQRFVGAASR